MGNTDSQPRKNEWNDQIRYGNQPRHPTTTNPSDLMTTKKQGINDVYKKLTQNDYIATIPEKILAEQVRMVEGNIEQETMISILLAYRNCAINYHNHQDQDTNDKKSRGRGDPLIIAKQAEEIKNLKEHIKLQANQIQDAQKCLGQKLEFAGKQKKRSFSRGGL